jgi:transposase
MMTPDTTREAQLTEEVTALRETVKAQEITIKLLREKIDLLVRRIFGKSSETMDDQQLMLLLQGEDASKKAPASGSDATGLEAELAKGDKELMAKTARNERKPRIPDDLPVSEELIIDPEEVKATPQAYRQMGEEVTEQLDYTPAKFSKRRIIRRKWIKCDEAHRAPVIARLDTLAERSLAAPGLLAQIIVAKYCDHLPLYRQEQIYKLRHRIELPRQSMARWLALAAQWLTPLYERIHTGVMAGGYVQVDETMVEYLQPGNGETKQGYLWTLKQPEGDAVFVWRTSRSAQCLSNIIPTDFTGIIGCDGYQAYQTHAAQSHGRLRLAACWAHVRRKFDEAKEAHPKQAASVLLLIQRLYQIEKHLRNKRMSPKLRQIIRQQQSYMIVQRIGALLRRWQEQHTFLPQSLMGKAIAYTLTLWSHLQVYLEDGRAQIDNNPVENAIRPTRGQEELAVHRRRQRRRDKCHPLHPHRSLSQPPHRPLGIPARCAHKTARHDQSTARRRDARCMAESSKPCRPVIRPTNQRSKSSRRLRHLL